MYYNTGNIYIKYSAIIKQICNLGALMPSPVAETAESFLNKITKPDGTIDLSALEKMGGGGTHAIYRSDKCPDLLLKVMYQTIGKDSIELSQHLEKLNGQYSELYEAFGESRCIIEKRSVQSIQSDPDGCDLHLMSAVPTDLLQYKNSYILLNNEQVIYVKSDGIKEEVQINDMSLLVKEVNKVKEENSSKIYLNKEKTHDIITSNGGHIPTKVQQAIVSIVPFDPCFNSDEKFGFNVESEELNETLIQSKRYLYGTASKSLLGNNEKANPYVIRNYPLLNKNFEKIFKLLDTEPGLVVPMREFLTKYKSFYKESGILLDTIGFDNVLFYKNDEGWQFKLGSVIKQDNGALTKEILEKIIENPAAVKESFEYYTSVYYMPACIRALNACAEKVGIEKIIDDITINDKTIDSLAQMHEQLNIGDRAKSCAANGNFSTALTFYNQYKPNENLDAGYDTDIRGNMGASYWKFIKAGGKETSRSEVKAYLNLLLDERNIIPEPYQKEVNEAIEGLTKQLLLSTAPADSISPAKNHQETTKELSQRYRHVLDDVKRGGKPASSEDSENEVVTDHSSPTPFQTTLKPKLTNG